VAPTHVVHTRPARGERRPLRILTDPDALASVREDAAHFPGGQAAGLIRVETEADVAAALALGQPVLPIGAQSSLTGGATPRGELVIATTRLDTIEVAGDVVRVAAGVPLDALQDALTHHGRRYPPVPTYAGACVGGAIATNAAGPATFKYGTTRRWVTALTVVLATGDVLDVERGEAAAHPDGYFEIVTSSGRRRVPISPVPWPAVPKCSAGYPLEAGMDLVDLFIGAEGTLGIVVSATLRTLSSPPAQCLAFVALDREAQALDLAAALRAEAHRTWQTGDARGLDIAAIEYADRRSAALLAEDGLGRAMNVPIDDATAGLLFVDIDLPPGTNAERARTMVENALEAGSDTPLGRLCRVLAQDGLLERTELALPGDPSRRRKLLDVREAVPQAVNRRVARAQQTISSAISKMAGDFIVPFPAVGAMEAACRQACARRALDLAIWGHLSDGNIHPNVLPDRAQAATLGPEALLEAAEAVIRLGGSPLAEHGVGRNHLKQRLLARLVGPDGLAAMRAVKRALDPEDRLSPGVLIPVGDPAA
jgi:D-lactate dehydrogenase (cytochrome)